MTTSAPMATPLQMLRQVSDEIFDRWDKDMRSGKLLTALAGRLTKYDPRVTAICSALAAAETHDARVTELLEANNREVERRRAEAARSASLLATLHKAMPVLEAMEDADHPESVEALAAARAAIADAGQPTHRHIKRGTTYHEMFRGGRVQTSRPIIEGDTLVSYIAADGTVWHRLPEEFDDGRFEAIGAVAGPNSGAAA
jgi:hypothetical protein